VTTNAVSVTLPREGYTHVARLVAGGFVSRLAVGFEAVDDLQLAIELILRAAPVSGGSATVALQSDEESLTVSIGPFEEEELRDHLHHSVHEGFDLGTYLTRLADGVGVIDGSAAAIVLRRSLGKVPSQ
jgi:hypothetical protein